jgi:5-deoxy-glucuronate isomerase
MAQYSLKYSERSGYTAFSGNLCGLKYIHEFGILSFTEEQHFSAETGGMELGIMILSGAGVIEIDGVSHEIGNRMSVFSGLPQAVYIPPGHAFTIHGKNLHTALGYTACESRAEKPRIIREPEVTVNTVGKDNWSREVRIVVPPNGFSKNLILGETLNPPGNWSGTPAHRHETNNVPQESLHEELYYFQTNQPAAWGIQRNYSPQRNTNEFILLDNHTITLMPNGYHQIVAGPGYWLYYLFFLAGIGNKLCGFADPENTWILNK